MGAFARGQHPRVLSRLRKCPLAAAPVGPSPVPLAEVAAEDVLDMLYNQVDGHCGHGRDSELAMPYLPRSQCRGTEGGFRLLGGQLRAEGTTQWDGAMGVMIMGMAWAGPHRTPQVDCPQGQWALV